MQYPNPGYNDVPAYLVSGIPFVTASSAVSATATKITFPYVTKFITIRSAGNLNIGFTDLGIANSNHFTMATGDYLTFEVRVKEIYIKRPSGGGSVNFHLVAGLTGIPTASIPTLTGSYNFSPSDPFFTGSNSYTQVLTYSGLG